MKLKYILSIAAILLLYKVNAQQRPAINLWDPPVQKGIRNLKIGDEVPDFRFKIFNDVKKIASISDYKDRLVILDFGNTRCSGCIAALPHMEALQKQFENQVEIFWVTPEYKEDVQVLWKRSKYTKNNTLPTIVEDSTARAYFKHKSWPHEAWIYKGKVVALTGPEYVDAGNIKKVLSGQPVSWPVKNDFYTFDAWKEPLFRIDSNQVDVNNTFIKYAAISNFKEGVPSLGARGPATIRDKSKKTVRTFLVNYPIYDAYYMLWSKVTGFNAQIRPGKLQPGVNEIIWEVSDPNKYKYTQNQGYLEDWLRKNGICFEAMDRDSLQTDKQIYQTVISDLNRLLGLNVRWEKRKEKVLVLVRTSKVDKLKSKKEIAYDNNTGDYVSKKYIQKGTLHQYRDTTLPIAGEMNKVPGNPYVFDETGFGDPHFVDMDLNIPSWKDITAVRKAIAVYDLDLKEEEREVDHFVFSEVNGGLIVDGQMQAEAKAKREAQIDMAGPSPEENSVFLVVNKKNPGVVTLPSGLQYKILKQGTGVKPDLNDKVLVHYTGALVNGKIFDSSFESGRPAEFKVDGMIKGWQEALPLMPVGSKWMIYVPAELAYGTHTNQGKLPSNSVLVFEIELMWLSN